MPSDLLTRLRVLRAEKDLTQQVLAEHLDMSYRAYNAIENGRSWPSVQTLIIIATFYNVSVDYLLGLTDNRER